MFGFCGRSYSELKLSGDMLGGKERAEGNGGGCRSAKVVKGDGRAEKKEEEEEDEEDKEWKAEEDSKRVPYTKNKWFLVAEYHDIDMEKALIQAAEIMIEDFNNAGGPLLDYGKPTERKIGPYGARNVSEEVIYIYFCYDKEVMMDLFVCVQGYDAKKSSALTVVFPCPFFRSCNCNVQWQYKHEGRSFWLFCNARHHRRSHLKYNGKFLGPAQKGAVSRAVQNNPNATGTMVMRNLANIPDDVIYIDPGLKESVDRFVRVERDVVLSRNLGGVSVAGNRHNEVQKLKKYCEERRFDVAIKRHNNNIQEDHIRGDTLLITSMQWHPEIHYGFTTVNDVMNIGRAINAGKLVFYTDGTFGISRYEVCLVGVRVGKRADGTATVGYSFNPSETREAMRATYDGLEAAFFGVFSKLKVCAERNCQLCQNIVEILKGAEMIRYKNSSKWAEKELPDADQLSDQGGGHASFVTEDRPDSRLLTCYQHIGSELICIE